MENITAKVQNVELINKDVYKVTLHTEQLSFKAGQYLLISMPTGEQVPYSIGSAPHELPELTLYILVTDESSLAHKVIKHLELNESVTLKAPGGDCHFDNPNILSSSQHILLIAGGTGFAQMKSLYSQLEKQEFSGKVSFYWGVRTEADIFEQDWIKSTSKDTSFTIDVVVNDANDQWQGKTGWLYESILSDHSDLSGSVAFVSGSPQMVYGTLDQLEARGLKEAHCFSDVFAYAPRPAKST